MAGPAASLGTAGIAFAGLAAVMVWSDVRFWQGTAFARHGAWHAAEAAHRDAVALGLHRREYRMGLGKALEAAAMGASSTHEAITLLRRAQIVYRDLLDGFPEAYHMLSLARVDALLFQLTNDAPAYARAQRLARQAARLDPNNPVILADAGAVLLQTADLEAAEWYLLASLALAPIAESHLNLGILYRMLGRYDQALHHAEAASLLTYSADVQTALGRAYMDAGRYDQALTPLQTAVNLDPNHIGARLAYAHLLQTWGEPGAAAEQLRAVLQRDPAHPAALQALRAISNAHHRE